MKPNIIGDARRAACSGARGSSPAAQRCRCAHPYHGRMPCRKLMPGSWRPCLCTGQDEPATQDDLGNMLARVFGGFGEVLETLGHNLEDGIADVRDLGGKR